MGSFFETYKEMKTGGFTSQQFTSANPSFGFYTCPADRHALIFLTSFESSFAGQVLFFNASRPAEQIFVKDTIGIDNGGVSIGMITLRPGEAFWARSEPINQTFFIATATWRVFEFNIASS